MLFPVSTEADHKRALARIDEIWDAQPGTPEHRELDALTTLVDAYEDRTCEMLPPTPIEAIRFRLEQTGKTRRDLEPHIGTRARVSEVLTGARALTLPMIRKLSRALNISADVLIAEVPKRHRPHAAKAAAPKATKPAKAAKRAKAAKSTRGKHASAT